MQKDISGGTYAGAVNTDGNVESNVTSVAWPAIIGGAFVATSVSLILLLLGSALGFASLSPWKEGPSPVAFTAASAIWLILMQWVSSGLGGYLTGRMRTKWARVHTHEVFFRDTANGLLTWAVATIATAALTGSVLASAIGGGAHAVMHGAAAAAPELAGAGARPLPPGTAAGPMGGPHAYVIDSLFRTDRPSPGAPEPEVRAEATRIILNGIKEDNLPPADRTYLAQVIAARTGISQPDAERRVDDTVSQIKTAEEKVKQAADTARKTAATVSLFTALSLLVGAFVACVGAAIGGRERDLHY